MSVAVYLRGTSGFGSLDFERPTVHSMMDTKAEEAEQFARVLEDIAADVRRMFPPKPEAAPEDRNIGVLDVLEMQQNVKRMTGQ